MHLYEQLWSEGQYRRAWSLYLASPEWRIRHGECLGRHAWCQRCHRYRASQAHHVTYARRFHERPDDLLALCHECHRRTHGVHSRGRARHHHGSGSEQMHLPFRCSPSESVAEDDQATSP